MERLINLGHLYLPALRCLLRSVSQCLLIIDEYCMAYKVLYNIRQSQRHISLATLFPCQICLNCWRARSGQMQGQIWWSKPLLNIPRSKLKNRRVLLACPGSGRFLDFLARVLFYVLGCSVLTCHIAENWTKPKWDIFENVLAWPEKDSRISVPSTKRGEKWRKLFPKFQGLKDTALSTKWQRLASFIFPWLASCGVQGPFSGDGAPFERAETVNVCVCVKHLKR